jgi:hypothetical protein
VDISEKHLGSPLAILDGESGGGRLLLGVPSLLMQFLDKNAFHSIDIQPLLYRGYIRDCG